VAFTKAASGWWASGQAPGDHQSADTIYSIKRFMGRKFSEIAEEAKNVRTP